jgi:thiol:disulfide interchange protein
MAISTMTKLRNINPISSTAAILPNHTLRFNIPGIPYIEPSYASVEPTSSSQETNVHGVLYALTPKDFETICQTEGVPFIYSLHRCLVVPYVGNGKTAGMDTLLQKTTTNAESTTTATTKDKKIVSAFTLRATSSKCRQEGYNIPPSQSYINVLLRGAIEFQLDEKYYQELENINVSTKIFGNGISEMMLQIAEKRA